MPSFPAIKGQVPEAGPFMGIVNGSALPHNFPIAPRAQRTWLVSDMGD